jgi:hypothetical protein
LYGDDGGYPSNISDRSDYHFQIGANVARRKFNLRGGLLLTYGSTSKYMQYVNFDNANESNVLAGVPHMTKATHFVAGFMLSHIHNL